MQLMPETAASWRSGPVRSQAESRWRRPLPQAAPRQIQSDLPQALAPITPDQRRLTNPAVCRTFKRPRVRGCDPSQGWPEARRATGQACGRASETCGVSRQAWRLAPKSAEPPSRSADPPPNLVGVCNLPTRLPRLAWLKCLDCLQGTRKDLTVRPLSVLVSAWNARYHSLVIRRSTSIISAAWRTLSCRSLPALRPAHRKKRLGQNYGFASAGDFAEDRARHKPGSDLVKPKDFARGRSDAPMRFEIEVELEAKIYGYVIAFEFPRGLKNCAYLRRSSPSRQSRLQPRGGERASCRKGDDKEASFLIDWHMVALPIIQQRSTNDPLIVFKQWLARMLILRPAPGLILGDSNEETLAPNLQITDFGAWFTGLLTYARLRIVESTIILNR